ncbi:helicase HerA domain-containing protein [Saliphagus sp. GCM10025334]
MSETREVTVGETADGTDVRLPVVELLTGRGFVTGKSGSGKSNTASVIAEELLEAGFPLLIVDTDGEYYGLKEEYEMLHAGADEECDIQIGPEHAEQMASLALEENVPVILDVSGYLDEEEADELLRETARQLFVKEKKLKKPFLLVVEEVHEYIPEGGGMGETGRLLIKIGKRGRKHGLGILGISQRPADVKKDFITQANWLVWHRLTWENDTNVVGRIIDSEYAELVSELEDGQAFVQTDWMDAGVRKIQFRRKRTFDAGATPGLDDFERPELKSVSDALVDDLQTISERKDREEDRIDELEKRLDRKDSRIETLEDELSSARDVSDAARQMADALSQAEPVQTTFPETGGDMRRLHDELVDLEDRIEELEAKREELEEENDDLRERLAARERELENRADELERLEAENEDLRERCRELELWLEPADSGDEAVAKGGSEAAADGGENADGKAESEAEAEGEATDGMETPILHADGDDLTFGYTSVDDASEDDILETGAADDPATGPIDLDMMVPDERDTIEDLLALEEISTRVTAACDDSRCDEPTARRVIETVAIDGPLSTTATAESVGRSPVAVQSLLSELRTRDVVDRRADGTYVLEPGLLDALDRTTALDRESTLGADDE